MKYLVPHRFRDGELMDAGRINDNLLALRQIAVDFSALRYVRSSFSFEFGALTAGAATPETTRVINAPWNIEITAYEVEVFGTSGVIATLNVAGATTFAPAAVTCLAVDERAVLLKDVSMRVAANTDISFTVTVDGAIVDARVTIHWRYDRGAADLENMRFNRFVEGSILVAQPIGAMPPPENKIQAALDEIFAEVDAVVAVTRFPSITVIEGPTGATFGADAVASIPDMGRTIKKLSVCGAASSGAGEVTAVLKDEAGGTVGTAAKTLSSTATPGTDTFGEVQPGGDISDAANDYSVEFSITSGAPTLAQTHAVLYME